MAWNTNAGMMMLADSGGVPAKPDQPINTSPSRPMKAVAISVPGNIITENAEDNSYLMVEELFENLSLFELMEFGRSDIVLGQNVVYQPIKNISDIYFTYDPKKILALQGTFGANIDPSASLRLGQYVVDGGMSLDPLTGEISVVLQSLKSNFVVQVEFVSGAEIQDS